MATRLSECFALLCFAIFVLDGSVESFGVGFARRSYVSVDDLVVGGVDRALRGELGCMFG
jgi:hypothetical protein